MTLELLKQFCGSDESRPSIMEPWSSGDWTYATDARIILRVPKREDVPVRTITFQDKVDSYYVADASDGNFVPMPTPPLEGWGKPCGMCNGGITNSVRCEECDGITLLPFDIKCPICLGSGRILELAKVKFGKHLLNAFYLQKMLALGNVTMAQHVTDHAAVVSFNFDGGSGRLMPMKLNT